MRTSSPKKSAIRSDHSNFRDLPLETFQGDQRIQAPRPEPFQVNRHELESERPERPHHLVAKLGTGQTTKLLDRDLDAGQVSLVVADPEQAEPTFAEPVLGLVDHPDALGG